MIKYTILLAEDDNDDFEFFTAAISSISNTLRLIRVNDGVALMNELENDIVKYDMLFLDINMPFKNGFECLWEIRNSEKHKKIPVIIFSTSSDDKSVRSMFHAGANGYIVKPTLIDNWKNVIQKAVYTNWDLHGKDVNFQNFVIE